MIYKSDLGHHYTSYYLINMTPIPRKNIVFMADFMKCCFYLAIAELIKLTTCNTTAKEIY